MQRIATTSAVSVFLLLLFHTYQAANAETGDGRQKATPFNLEGLDAAVGRFQYMCNFVDRRTGAHFCGGTLVHPEWIITAAHCITVHPPQLENFPAIFCGVYDVMDRNPARYFPITEIRIHIRWSGSVATGNDIALIKLGRPAHGITYPLIDGDSDRLSTGDALVALGWGLTHDNVPPHSLQAGILLADFTGSCVAKAPMEICAGGYLHHACKGDSGGPLLVPGIPGKSRDILTGVVSSGDRYCTAYNRPSVFTSIPYYATWIVNNVRGHPSNSVSYVIPQASTENTSIKALLDAIKQDDVESALAIVYQEGLKQTFNDHDLYDGSAANTVLHWAARFGASQLTEAILKEVKNEELSSLLSLENSHGHTPLAVSAFYGNEAVAKILLLNGAFVDAAGYDEKTPLHWAARRGHIQIVKTLIEFGAQMNKVDSNGKTPVMEALDMGHSDIVKILLQNGADANLANHHGETPLIVAS